MHLVDPRFAPAPAPPAARRVATLALGFALGGFFDGILLHQVLQWHHLLSGIDAPALADPGAQVLADGLFHAAMYVVAALAIGSLLRPGQRPRGLRTAGLVLLGFAAWHALDAVLAHWVLGLHRIRMDVGAPLAWDLGWLAVFGGLPAALGARWARAGLAHDESAGAPGPDRAKPGPPEPGREAPGRTTTLAWIGLAIAAGLVAAQPPAPEPDGARTVAAVLGRAGDAGRLLAALPPGATIVDADGSGRLWRIRLPADASALRLVGYGAVWVAGTAATPGCGAWTASGGI